MLLPQFYFAKNNCRSLSGNKLSFAKKTKLFPTAFTACWNKVARIFIFFLEKKCVFSKIKNFERLVLIWCNLPSVSLIWCFQEGVATRLSVSTALPELDGARVRQARAHFRIVYYFISFTCVINLVVEERKNCE